MRARTCATAILSVFLAAGCHKTRSAATPAPGGHFALILEHSATGWAAHCEAGCLWTDVSMSCAGCEVRLDAAGIGRAYPSEAPATGFAFVLSGAGGGGWTARGIQGVNWRSLSWNCGAATCRARLDENGLRGT
jgi:hypothetical protein